MDLSDIQSLSTEGKLLWLRSEEGLSQLQKWLSAGLTLGKVSKLIALSSHTIYRWRAKYPEIAEVTQGYAPVPTKVAPVNHSRDLTYRIICGLDSHNHRGQILAAYDTAEEVWSSPFIKRYFASFSKSELDYRENYLHQIAHSGVYRLSNLYQVIYGSVNRRGIIKPLKPTS